MGPVTEPRAVATGPCSLKEFESDKRPVARGPLQNREQ